MRVPGLPGSVDALAWRVVLAAPPTPGVPGGPRPGAPPGSERGEEFGKTSPIALVVILLLGLATALLIRSMSKRLKNVPASFDDVDPRTGVPTGTASTGTPSTGGADDRGPAAERLDPPDRRGPPGPGTTGSP